MVARSPHVRDLGGDAEGLVTINRHAFKVEVATTPSELGQGLSGVESLGANEGMLFVFDKPSVRTFWMRNILMSIDIIWIRDGEVIGFVENVSPEPGVPTFKLTKYSPPGPVDHVLEVGAGVAKRINLSVGDKVSIRIH